MLISVGDYFIVAGRRVEPLESSGRWGEIEPIVSASKIRIEFCCILWLQNQFRVSNIEKYCINFRSRLQGVGLIRGSIFSGTAAPPLS